MRHPWSMTRRARALAAVTAVLWCAACVLVLTASHVDAKGIHVTVEASWNETSFYQEGCEWAGRNFGATAFYSCLDALWKRAATAAVAAGGTHPNAELWSARYATQQAQHAAIHEVALGLAETRNTADAALFQLEMAARVYSPAVEAHYAMAMKALTELSSAAEASVAAAAACTCGEPFAVLYTRVASSPAKAAVVLAQQRLCTPEAVGDARQTLQQQRSNGGEVDRAQVSVAEVSLPRLDHRYPSAASPAQVDAVLVLYGLAGSPATEALHAAAVQWAAADGEATLALLFRHLPVSRSRLCGSRGSGNSESVNDDAAFLASHWDTPLAVQGYGATVDIKNMEYKVLDEKAAAQQRAKEEAEGNTSASSTTVGPATPQNEADRVVGGFHLQRLQARYTHLSAALNEFATVMDEETGSGGDMKVDFDVWELQNIGLAATQYIRELDSHSRRLHVLRDVVNRFPLYAAALSRIAAQPSRFEAVQKTLAGLRQRLPPGQSALFVDGWRVEEKDMSLFGVLDALQADEQLSRQVKTVLALRPAGAAASAAAAEAEAQPQRTATAMVDVEPTLLESTGAFIKRAAHRPVQDDTSVPAFAIPAEFITWLNDVESDQGFEGMPTQLNTFFTQARGATPFPRRNVLNFVFVWDPTSRSNVQMITLVYRMSQQGLMARFGVALYDPAWSPEIAAADPSIGHAPPAYSSPSSSSLSTSEAVQSISAVVYHLTAAGHGNRVIEVMVQLFQATQGLPQHASDEIPTESIQNVCNRIVGSFFDEDLEELMSDPEFVNHYHETQAALRRFPMSSYPATLLNGVLIDVAGGGLSSALQSEVAHLRGLVSAEKLRDDMEDLYTAVLHLRGAADHLQPALHQQPQTMRWTDTPAAAAFIAEAPYMYTAAYAGEVPSLTQLIALPCQPTKATVEQLQTVLAALAACRSGAASEKTAGDQHHESVCQLLRISLVACPAASPSSSPVPAHMEALLRLAAQRDVAETKRYANIQRYLDHLTHAIAAMPAASTSEAYRLHGLLDSETVTAALKHSPLPNDLQVSADAANVAKMSYEGRRDLWTSLEAVTAASSAVGHDGGGDGHLILVTNGRVVAMDSSFTTWDVLEAAQLVMPMTKTIESAVLKINFVEMTTTTGEGGFAADDLDNGFFSSRIACLVSLFESEKMQHEDAQSTELVREEALFATADDWKRLRAVLFTVNNTPAATTSSGRQHHITAVVDPSSREAQVIVSLAHFLLQSPLRIKLNVLLNPSLDVKFPIRDFYEYVASATVTFDDTTGRPVAPAATFAQMPSTALLTLGVEEPPTWTVFSQDAEEDLDNIMLSKLSRGSPFVFAVYRMHSILVTGDATDAATQAPPDGLPLSLTPPHMALSSHGTRSTDTQVMANQGGYYQLQAAPGVWYLSVKPGPVAAAYCVERVGRHAIAECARGATSFNFSAGQRIPVVIDSFSGRHLSLRVRHTPLLAASAADNGDLHTILQQMASTGRPTWPPAWHTRGAKAHPPEKPTLNIFSVASGHLYERFLRMMFYSVHKTSSDQYGANTTRIKFWVIENFLSPQFKRYIPLLAESLGFEVGFVTYRWPWWLPRQTEKQRKIWAYKILFLDVLFPLDVDRIIFVDADQTAQADLHELYNMDIGEKPVAMTPFCQTSKNEATVPFRFWEHGFWVNHLHGKPYHISAIFLVDLRRFRAMLAGDRYRSTYAALSSDPNSLSNLDQDLPNYLQATIPIHSLPEQWLWCETWCSAKSKSRAKTIDLCNNPLTKMPKLDNAKMVIPGWEDLDNKLQNLSDTLLAGH